MEVFLSVFYGLICVGYMVGLLIDNDDIPSIVRVLMVIFSPILTPFLLAAGSGMMMIAKIKEETNRE